MDAELFTTMLADRHFPDLKKMQYKYSPENVSELMKLLSRSMFTELPLRDFAGGQLVYLEGFLHDDTNAVKQLLNSRSGSGAYGVQAMTEEIYNSLGIENINSSRESVRRILDGYAPANDSEIRILGMKKGLEFISDTHNRITEENLHYLYQLTVGDFLDSENSLLPGNFYRHDKVYIIGSTIEHQGINSKLLPEYMKALIAYINTPSNTGELAKAAVIHFYLAYLHPYFDGNGRTARFLQLWYLVQCGYSSALFVPFSSYINETRSDYYRAFSLIESNSKISSRIDVTPFLNYFNDNIYSRLGSTVPSLSLLDEYDRELLSGNVTEKENSLWNYVLSVYGMNEFSTKQLERDYGKAAYGTIRTFVQKFEKLGLLKKRNYNGRPKYSINS